jgi:iron-sulfur cluster assembly protein
MVSVTERAAQEIRSIMSRDGIEAEGLRIFVAGGGCSGFQYKMHFEDEVDPRDNVFETHGVKVFVDPQSLQHIDGSVIDYVTDMLGGGFKVENPNAISSCGCGHSFKTAASPEGQSCCG